MNARGPVSAGPSPLVVMGVSGVGKTTIGRELAQRLGTVFIDADDLHGEANIAKMSAGIPLDDDDRGPWLDRVGAQLAAGDGIVIACSALARRYRDRLRRHAADTLFVHLVADPSRVAAQTSAREGHFMPPELLHSQFAALEPLGDGEAGIDVFVDTDAAALADRIVRMLRSGVS